MLDCEQPLSVFTWTYSDYPGPSTHVLGITMAARGAAVGPLHVRCTLMWAPKTLPLRLIRDRHCKGDEVL